MGLFKRMRNFCSTLGATKSFTVLLIFIVVFGAGFFYACDRASHRAADIFNYYMEKQQALQGRVTAQKIAADMWGNVYFTSLEWTAPDGEQLITAQQGRLKVSPWDVVWNRAGTRSIKEIELDGAQVNLAFDKEMRLDIVGKQKQGAAATAKKTEQPKPKVRGKAGPHLQIDAKVPRMKLILRDTILGASYDNRLFVLNDVNGEIDLRQEELEVHLSSGAFGGTMIGDGFNLDGVVSLNGEQQISANIGLYDVVPESLGVRNAKDPMTITGEVKGKLASPSIDGSVALKELNIPNLKFTKVSGLYNYADGVVSLNDVTGNIFGGTLDAYGMYNFNGKYYKIYVKCHGLSAASAAKNTKIQCSVDLDIQFHQRGHGNDIVFGKFETGKGSYMFVPFKKISGIFSNQKKELDFANVVIRTDLGDIESQAFKIVDGKVILSDIFFVETDGRRTKIK